MDRRLRVHHILCISLFRGEGYSDGFCRGMNRFANTLKQNPDTYIISVCDPDSVCQNCPHKTSENTCGKDHNRIADRDRRLAEILGLRTGEPHTWKELRELVRRRLTERDFEEICGDCSWYAAGLCSYVALVQKLQ